MTDREINGADDDGANAGVGNVPNQNNDDNSACVPIVNALLTFIISMFHNATDPKIIELIGRYFDSTTVKNAKCVLCDVGKMQFKNRLDSENRSEKMAHARDIVDMLRNLDRESILLCLLWTVLPASHKRRRY